MFLQRHSEPVIVSQGVNGNDNFESVSSHSANKDGKLCINSATAEELTMLNGVGSVVANNIVSYRQENGPFRNINELLNVKGIGQKRLSLIAGYITVGD